MESILLPIDTKSLYLNIRNDNQKGHTCTVATPIKQRDSINQELMSVFKIPKQIDFNRYPDFVAKRNKQSKSVTRTLNVFVFDRFRVNGQLIRTDKKFCMFIKEEVDPSRYQYGRQKLHYPQSFKYEDLNIDNSSVLQSVSKYLNGFAFIVKAFEYRFEDDSLNFVASIVGYPNIPYSKVFINLKGAGSKFTKEFSHENESYDFEIMAMKKRLGEDKVDVMTYPDLVRQGHQRAVSLIKDYLMKKGAEDIVERSFDYPYSLYDRQYEINGITYYAMVHSTFTNQPYADVSMEEMAFYNSFRTAVMFIVSDLYQSDMVSIFSAKDNSSYSTSVLSARMIFD